MNYLPTRWLMAGSSVYILDFICFILLYQVFQNIFMSNLGSMIIASGLGFVLNQYWVYDLELSIRYLVKFIISICVSIALNSALLVFITSNSAITIQAAKVLTSLILLPVNFALSRIMFKVKVKSVFT